MSWKHFEGKITKYKGDEKIIIIPSELDGYAVTSIGERAFYGCSGLTTVSLPDRVQSIRKEAFHGCSGLTTVTIPDSVQFIGPGAFKGCASLTSINFSDRVTSIGIDAFDGCENLTAIVVKDSYGEDHCISNNIPYTYLD